MRLSRVGWFIFGCAASLNQLARCANVQTNTPYKTHYKNHIETIAILPDQDLQTAKKRALNTPTLSMF